MECAGFFRRSFLPYMMIVILASPVWLPMVGWVYLRLTTRDKITARLHAMGLPASGLELESWRQPEDDGREEFREAIKMWQALKVRIGDEEVERLRDLKPEEYTDNKVALEALLADLAPICQKMNEATRHKAITWGVTYRHGFAADNSGLKEFRQYMLMLSANAEYESAIGSNPGAALTLLRDGLCFVDSMHCYCLIEHLVNIAAGGILLKQFDNIFQRGGVSSEQLRGFSLALLNPDALRRYKDNLHNAFVGEFACVCTYYDSPGVEDLLDGTFGEPAGWRPLTRDVDFQYMFARNEELRSFATMSYSESKPLIKAYDSEAEEKSSSAVFVYLHHVALSSNIPARALFNWHFNPLTERLQAGIACELVADRLEGRDWPENLDDSRWPRDPFTDQPFQLIFTDDSLLICSTGPDQAHSGKAEIFNRTGRMEHSTEVPAVASEDDIIFRIPRAIYETPAAPIE